jgi:hypothetical protein
MPHSWLSNSFWRDRHPIGSEQRQRIEDAVEYGPRFGERALIGWDYARMGYLCRSGYLIALMSEVAALSGTLFLWAPRRNSPSVSA